MVKKTDTEENARFEGTITVVTSDNPGEYGYGDLEIEGTIFADKILQNTDNQGVNLEDVLFNDGYYDMLPLTTPTNPGTDDIRFFTNNQLFKSLDNVGKLTTYQPTNTKGDLTAHNNTTQVRLPIGNQGNVLVVDSTTDTGVKWGVPTGGDLLQKTRCVLIDQNEDGSAFAINKHYGSFFMNVYPYNKNGSTCNFIFSKSLVSINSNTTRLNSNPSLVSSKQLSSIWDPFQELKIYKDYPESKGEYFIYNNNIYSEKVIQLNSVSFTNLPSDIYNVFTGIFFISIYPRNPGGSSASFFIGKNDATSNTAAITRISSSPGSGTENLNLRWLMGSGVTLNKTTADNDGDYFVIDNHQFSKTTTIALAGTSIINIPVQFFRFYTNKTFIVKIDSSIVGSPKALILFSKNDNLRNGNKTIFQIKGITTEEYFIFTWNSNELLKISKSGNGYDGNYFLSFTPFE
jgi:hypothetical protein